MTQIQEKRHQAVALVSEAAAALQVPELDTVQYALRGTPGLSKDQQVERLTQAQDAVNQAKRKLNDAVTAYQTKLDEAKAVLAEAIDVASTRDFDAYKADKSSHEEWPGHDDDDDDDEDEDDTYYEGEEDHGDDD